MNAFRIAFVALLGLLSVACTTTGAPSLLDNGQSPRATAVAAMDKTIEVLDKASAVIVVAPPSDNLADDVLQYAPEVEAVAIRYLDATAPCVVVDGRLTSDPKAGASCDPSAFRRAFGSLSDALFTIGQKVGVDTDGGRALLVGSIVLKRNFAPSSGDVVTGYEKIEDVPLEQYVEMRAALRAAADKFLGAVQTTLDRKS
jgi:hypothetical protein